MSSIRFSTWAGSRISPLTSPYLTVIKISFIYHQSSGGIYRFKIGLSAPLPLWIPTFMLSLPFEDSSFSKKFIKFSFKFVCLFISICCLCYCNCCFQGNAYSGYQVIPTAETEVPILSLISLLISKYQDFMPTNPLKPPFSTPKIPMLPNPNFIQYLLLNTHHHMTLLHFILFEMLFSIGFQVSHFHGSHLFTHIAPSQSSLSSSPLYSLEHIQS